MSKFKFELNGNGVKELLNSAEMKKILVDEANSIKNKAGSGYEISEYSGKNRPNVSVKAESEKARMDNNQNNTLLKAIK